MERLPDPKDMQRRGIVELAVARAVVMAPEHLLVAFANSDSYRGSAPLAQRIVRELHHSGFRLKNPDGQPFAPDDDVSPRRRMALEDYVQTALDLTSVGTRTILMSYDRRNQARAISEVSETIVRSFRVSKVVLERRRNAWDR